MIRILAILVVILCWIAPAHARFLPSDEFNGGVSVNGVGTDHFIADVQTAVPLDFINGYAGIQLHHRRSEGESIIEAFKLHTQGGLEKEHFIAKAYIDLEGGHRQIEMTRHAGGFVEVPITKNIGVGVGTYMELRDYLESEDINIEDDHHFGWRGHLNVAFGDFKVMAEYLPQMRFDVFMVRITPVYHKHLWGPVSFVLSGELRYDSETAHVEIEPWHVEYKKLLQFAF